MLEKEGKNVVPEDGGEPLWRFSQHGEGRQRWHKRPSTERRRLKDEETLNSLRT